MRNEIGGAWSREDNGWRSHDFRLDGDGILKVELPDYGYVVIRKSEEKDGVFRRALTSVREKNFEFKIYGETNGRYLRVITSIKPTRIYYDSL